MKCEIRNEKANDNAFAVCLVGVPNFPTGEKLDPIIREPLLAVVGATCTIDGWSFVILDKDEKHCIGDEMLRLKIKKNEWKYCTIYT